MTELCESQIRSALDPVDGNTAKIMERVAHLKSKLKKIEASLLALKGDYEALCAERRTFLDEVERLKGELSQSQQTRESYMNKVVELQKAVDKGEKFCDLVNDMLKDTYYRFWSEGNLKWMDDYPQVMARIHSRVLQEAKSTAAGKGELLSTLKL